MRDRQEIEKECHAMYRKWQSLGNTDEGKIWCMGWMGLEWALDNDPEAKPPTESVMVDG